MGGFVLCLSVCLECEARTRVHFLVPSLRVLAQPSPAQHSCGSSHAASSFKCSRRKNPVSRPASGDGGMRNSGVARYTPPSG